MPSRALALAALLAVTPALAADKGEVDPESVYFEGLEEFRARAFERAMDSFERVVALGATDRLRTRALQGFARSALELSQTRSGFACARLAGMGRAFDDLPGDDAAAAQARTDVTTLRARCEAEREAAKPAPASEARPPRVTPPTRPDYSGAWILTASAGAALATGVALEVLALDALDARAAAVDHYHEATGEAGRIEAARAVGRHEGTARTRAEFGYALLGLGGLLGAAAIWAWVDPPEAFEAPFAVAPSGRGVTVRASW